MSYIATVYVEGGDHDGQTFACGPFETADVAADAAADLMGLGTADYLALHANAEAVIAAL